MSSVNTLLNQRLKKGDHSSKMAAMAKRSAEGNLTSFSGIFSIVDLSDREKTELETILIDHTTGRQDIQKDLATLVSITSEVKAINNQAALLHGERIKKAHTLLTSYRDGAFTLWLLATYGNRQTPYNFMQYYEFCEALPKPLRPQLELMPRQAIYTLASRDGSLTMKQKIVEDYKGETKEELLSLIRDMFPLSSKDKRKQNHGETIILGLSKLSRLLQNKKVSLSKMQKKQIQALLEEINQLSENC
jgi:hypothetical protein